VCADKLANLRFIHRESFHWYKEEGMKEAYGRKGVVMPVGEECTPRLVVKEPPLEVLHTQDKTQE